MQRSTSSENASDGRCICGDRLERSGTHYWVTTTGGVKVRVCASCFKAFDIPTNRAVRSFNEARP